MFKNHDLLQNKKILKKIKMKLDDIDCVSAIIGTSLTNIKLFFHFSICPLFGSFALIYVYKWLLHLFAL